MIKKKKSVFCVQFEQKNLLIFFLLTFFWSWIFWMPEVFWGIRLYLAPFGPTISAFILTFINEGVIGVKKLLKRGMDFKFKKIWFIPIFLLMPSIVGLSLLIAIILGETPPSVPIASQPWIIIPAFFQILFLGGPVAEEFGWRGYALDRLQKRFNALWSSVILGIIWGIWRLPLFFMKGQDIYRNVPFIGFIMGTIFLSILITWIYNNTGKSILAVLIFHTMGNLAHFIFPAMGTQWGGLFSVILNILIVSIILIFWGPQTLTRNSDDKNKV